MKKYFNFSYNWNNKLDCKAFTTLRLSDKCEVGDELYCSLDGKRLPHLYKVVERRALKLDMINDFIGYLDSGYSAEETKELMRKMYKKRQIDWSVQTVFLYLIVRIEP